MSASFGAKNSSFAASTAPPRRSDARSIRSVKSRMSHRVRGCGEQLAARLGEDAVAMDEAAPKVRRAHDAAQPAAGVWRERMAVLQQRWIDDEARPRIPDDEIGVASGGDVSLPLRQPDERRRRAAH